MALSVITKTKFTLHTTVEGVQDGKLMVKINDIYTGEVHVMNFVNLFNLGSEVRGVFSEYIGKPFLGYIGTERSEILYRIRRIGIYRCDIPIGWCRWQVTDTKVRY